MKEQELNNMINNFILNRDGIMTIERSDVNKIRNAGTLMDGGQATCESALLYTTLQQVFTSIVTSHPDKKAKAALVQLEANDLDQAHTAVPSFLDTLDDIDAVWSIARNDNLSKDSVKIYMLVSMG